MASGGGARLPVFEKRRKNMDKDKNIGLLFKRLNFLGYRAFEIKSILHEATGGSDFDTSDHRHCNVAVMALEKYERLGLDYLNSYSK
jgi:hypothetical protein